MTSRRLFNGDLLARTVAHRLLYSSMTMRDAAAAAGVSGGTICRIARGEEPNVHTLGLLAAWLGLTVDYFYSDAAESGGTRRRRSQLPLTRAAAPRGTYGDGA